jgi:hypothetical protein
MRLVCQRIAQKANFEEQEVGKFWQSRYRAVRLIDEESILACAAYVDLNPIRAAIAENLESSDFTSVQRRISALRASVSSTIEVNANVGGMHLADAILSPLEIDELNDELGPRPSKSGTRCSDKGFLAMPVAGYIELLDWTARQLVSGKRGATPESAPAIFERIKIRPEVWCELVSQFGKLFSVVAGQPHRVDDLRGRRSKKRYYLRQAARELLCS